MVSDRCRRLDVCLALGNRQTNEKSIIINQSVYVCTFIRHRYFHTRLPLMIGAQVRIGSFCFIWRSIFISDMHLTYPSTAHVGEFILSVTMMRVVRRRTDSYCHLSVAHDRCGASLHQSTSSKQKVIREGRSLPFFPSLKDVHFLKTSNKNDQEGKKSIKASVHKDTRRVLNGFHTYRDLFC